MDKYLIVNDNLPHPHLEPHPHILQPNRYRYQDTQSLNTNHSTPTTLSTQPKSPTTHAIRPRIPAIANPLDMKMAPPTVRKIDPMGHLVWILVFDDHQDQIGLILFASVFDVAH